jgi:Carboxypeptidase regulatory-like domain/DNA circularisation protein N-terminus
MNIEIDGIALVKSEQAEAGSGVEIRNVSNISTTDRRNIVEHQIPGMEGSVFQNMGRAAVRISFEGTLQGRSAKNKLETIRSKFKQGIPLPFNSDISGAADVTQVLIENLRISEEAGITDRYQYSIVICEYKEPPPEPTIPPSQDEGAAEWNQNESGETIEAINYITGKVLDHEGNPKTGVPVIIRSEAGEYRVETNEEGIYRQNDLTPARYRVTVESEEYRGIEKEVVIGSGGGGEEQGEGSGEDSAEEGNEGEIEDEGLDEGEPMTTEEEHGEETEDRDQEIDNDEQIETEDANRDEQEGEEQGEETGEDSAVEVNEGEIEDEGLDEGEPMTTEEEHGEESGDQDQEIDNDEQIETEEQTDVDEPEGEERP